MLYEMAVSVKRESSREWDERTGSSCAANHGSVLHMITTAAAFAAQN